MSGVCMRLLEQSVRGVEAAHFAYLSLIYTGVIYNGTLSPMRVWHGPNEQSQSHTLSLSKPLMLPAPACAWKLHAWETDSKAWGTFGARQDGALCTQRSVNLGEPGRVEDPPGESRWPAAQRLSSEWFAPIGRGASLAGTAPCC